MLDLQYITIQYLQDNFQPELLSVMLDACTVLQRFNLTGYEFDLVNLISQASNLENDDLRDLFIDRVRQELVGLLTSHYITLDPDGEPSLREINEIALFLLLLQDLENTEQVAYRVHGQGSAKSIVVDLMGIYSTLERFRVMEIIANVDMKLIWAISSIVTEQVDAIDSDARQRSVWAKFHEFISDTDCLGVRLHREGYFGLALQELIDLSRFSIADFLDRSAQDRVASAALNTLSLLCICRDCYEHPLLSFDKNASTLFIDSERASRVRAVIVAMVADFNLWLEAQRQGDAMGKGVVA